MRPGSRDSFGNVTRSTGSLANPFQYTGRDFDAETGFSYYRARYYDPAYGRFISEDPMGFGGGFDFYAYVEDDPINSSDPLGLYSIHLGIDVHSELDIDQACGTDNAGACTKAVAILMCTCHCAGSGWKATTDLHVLGDMYVFNGHWPYKGRQHPGVDSSESAIDHEWNVHLTPAIDAVIPIMTKLEAKTFKSQAQCEKGCRKAEKAVRNEFDLSLQETEREEKMQ